MVFKIPKGTPGYLVQDGCRKAPFYTRKDLDFSASERTKSDPGKLAFRRRGFVLIIDTNHASLPVSVHKAIAQCLLTLPNKVSKIEDRSTLQSLAMKARLSTAQAILAGFLIFKYRHLLPELYWREATRTRWQE